MIGAKLKKRSRDSDHAH